MSERQPERIIVLLGGGFSDQEHVDLDQFLLDSSPVRERPRVCFIPTASGDSKGYVERFYDGLGRFGCELTHLDLFQRTVIDLDAFLAEPGRPEAYASAVRTGALPPGLALHDGAAARFRNERLDLVYRSDPAADLHEVT